jgi:hypothetical protein
MTGGRQFDAVWGTERGITDSQELLRLLAQAERELAAAHERAAEQQRETATLRDRLRRVETHRAAATRRARDGDQRFRNLQIKIDRLNRDRDRDRYAAARVGVTPPYPLRAVHQGVWTPGRPYLPGEHVLCPQTGGCYRIHPEGEVALPGARPGHRRVWERCLDSRQCPTPPTTLPYSKHPAPGGRGLRQTEYWWDAQHNRWPLGELSREHLLNVIDWLADNTWRMYVAEGLMRYPLHPCPVEAYPTSAAWMADTPLWRALHEEKRRRRIRRGAARSSR